MTPQPKLKLGDSKILSAWVHDTMESNVLLNHAWWPGVSEGDLIQITPNNPESKDTFLFVVSNEDSSAIPQRQVSVYRTISHLIHILTVVV